MQGMSGNLPLPTEIFAQEIKVYRTLQKTKKCRFNVSPEARTSEILCKPTEEQNHRLTRGLSPVYQRDEKRSLFLAADQWNDAFSCKACPGKCGNKISG